MTVINNTCSTGAVKNSHPATDCITLFDMSLMLLNKLFAPFTTPSKVELPDEVGAGGPLGLAIEQFNMII